MSAAELERVTEAWPPISHAVRVPHTEADYRELVELLDRVTDDIADSLRQRRSKFVFASKLRSASAEADLVISASER